MDLRKKQLLPSLRIPALPVELVYSPQGVLDTSARTVRSLVGTLRLGRKVSLVATVLRWRTLYPDEQSCFLTSCFHDDSDDLAPSPVRRVPLSQQLSWRSLLLEMSSRILGAWYCHVAYLLQAPAATPPTTTASATE